MQQIPTMTRKGAADNKLIKHEGYSNTITKINKLDTTFGQHNRKQDGIGHKACLNIKFGPCNC